MDVLPERAPHVSVVVLSWNRREKLDRCIRSLSRVEYPNVTIFVADNGSEEFDAAAIPVEFGGVRLVRNDANLGVAAGKNAMLRRLLSDGQTEFILFLDDDTISHPRLIRRLVDIHDPQRGWDILQPAVYDLDRPESLYAYGGHFNHYTGGVERITRAPRPEDPTDEASRIDFALGCGMFTHKSVFEAVGLFDEAFSPWYGEDVDFCLRAAKRHYESVVVPDAILWREIGKGASVRLSRSMSLRSEKRVYLMKKHSRWRQWIPYVVLAPVASALAALFDFARGRPHAGIGRVVGFTRGLTRGVAAGRSAAF